MNLMLSEVSRKPERSEFKILNLMLDLCFSLICMLSVGLQLASYYSCGTELHWLQNSIALATENDLDMLKNSVGLFQKTKAKAGLIQMMG